MKKHILWILPLITLIIIIFLYTSIPYFYRTWFNIRHAIVYFLFAYILVFGVYYLTKRVVQRIQNKQFLTKLIIILNKKVVCTILFLVNILQVTYIDLYQVPQLDGCSYYDYLAWIRYQEDKVNFIIVKGNPFLKASFLIIFNKREKPAYC